MDMEWKETETKDLQLCRDLQRLFSCIDYDMHQGRRHTFQDIARFGHRIWPDLEQEDIYNKIVAKFRFRDCKYPDINKLNWNLMIKYDLLLKK